MTYKTTKILKDSLLMLCLTAILSMISGTFLNISNRVITKFSIILLIVPAFISISGNIASIIASRISTALHLGKIHQFKKSEVINQNIIASLIIGLISFTIIGIIGETVLRLVGKGGMGYLHFLFVTIFAGVTSTLLISGLSVIIAYLSFKYGFDPDNTTIPLITTLGDVFGICILILTIKLIGG